MDINLRVYSTRYVTLSSLVDNTPKDVVDELLADPPFTWGDCDLSLVSVENFKSYVDSFPDRDELYNLSGVLSLLEPKLMIALNE